MALPDSTIFPLTYAEFSHLVTAKLSPSNFLFWRNQVRTLFQQHGLFDYVDGTISEPYPLDPTDATKPNPEHLLWTSIDKRLYSLIISSLTETTFGVLHGQVTARDVWATLESKFSSSGPSQELGLRDALQQLHRGHLSVKEYSRQFLSLCDQLAALGRPVSPLDQSHWFLRGLGVDFAAFAGSQLSHDPLPSVREIISRAENFHALYHRTVAGTSSPALAFTAVTPPLLATAPAVSPAAMMNPKALPQHMQSHHIHCVASGGQAPNFKFFFLTQKAEEPSAYLVECIINSLSCKVHLKIKADGQSTSQAFSELFQLALQICFARSVFV